MMKKNIFYMLAGLSVVFAVAFMGIGCAPKAVQVKEVPAQVEVEQPMVAVEEVVREIQIVEVEEERQYGGIVAEELLETQVAAAVEQDVRQEIFLEGRTSAPMLPVYFDFDKFNIRADQVDRINHNADFLWKNPKIRIRIEGNTDERGTNEYNMALGERRAITAKRYLMNKGVAENRIKTISFGEEKPLVYGHDELAWAQNRRSDFVIDR